MPNTAVSAASAATPQPHMTAVIASSPQARFAMPTSIWKLSVRPMSHLIRAASERWKIECRTNDTTPRIPTAKSATGLIASAPPPVRAPVDTGADHVSSLSISLMPRR